VTFNVVVNNQQRMTAVFAALADPTRRRIVQRLSQEGEIRVSTLAQPFRMSLPAISRHLRVLEEARLVRRQRRGREHWIRSSPTGLEDARRWIAQCAAGWEHAFDNLDRLLKTTQQKEKMR
jgi:DNA-binding transcriptional ArsR family regulator